MFFMRMAVRNIFRQYGRTALSMISIIAGVAVIIMSRGLTSGFKENIIRAQIDTLSSHVQIRPVDYPDTGLRYPVDNLLTLSPDDEAWLNEHSPNWTRRVLFTPRAVRGPDAVRVPAYGFDPVTDERVFPRTEWKVQGTIPTTADQGVLISRGLSNLLKLKVGDSFILEVRTPAGAINALDVPVSGVLATGSPMIDHLGVFVPQPLVLNLLRSEELFSHLSIRLEDRDQSGALAEVLRSRLGPDADISTWQIDSKGLLEAQDLRQFMLDVVAAALVAIAATGIANTILMAAYERVREVGTLRAMGMTQRGVLGLFMAEGLVMGMVGASMGALLGGWVVWKYAQQGIDLTPMLAGAEQGGTYNNIPFSSMLYLVFSQSTIVYAGLFGIVVAVLASVYPARIAANLPPAEAVRAE